VFFEQTYWRRSGKGAHHCYVADRRGRGFNALCECAPRRPSVGGGMLTRRPPPRLRCKTCDRAEAALKGYDQPIEESSNWKE
jgi:hypothetical protein